MIKIKSVSFIVFCTLLFSPHSLVYAKYGLNPTPQEFIEKSAKIAKYRAFLPEKIDLSPFMPPVWNQGPIQSCLSWSANYYIRSYMGYRFLGEKDFYSPSFMYDFFAKGDCNKALNFEQMEKFMTNNGSLTINEYDLNYDTCKIDKNLNNLLVSSKKKNKITNFYFASSEKIDLDSIKGVLYREYPIIAGIEVSEKFDSYKGGIFTYINKGTDETFGHAVTIVGYDDSKSAFKIVNSWGEEWGEKGYAWYDYNAFLANHTVTAFYDVEGISFENSNKIPEPEPNPKPIPEPEPTPKPIPKPIPEPEPNPELNIENINEVIGNLALEYECSYIAAQLTNNQIEVFGFLENQSDFDKFMRQVSSYYPSRTINKDFLRVGPWPTCELALTALKAGENSLHNNNLKIELSKTVFKNNDLLDAKINLEITKGFLSVFYLQADGTAVQIIKDKKIKNNKLTLSKLRSEDDLIISAPFGHEAIVGVITQNKNQIVLTDEILEDRNFLTQLRIKLFELANNNELISISPVFVETAK